MPASHELIVAVLGATFLEMQDVSQCCDTHFWIILISSVNTSFDIAEIHLGTTELCQLLAPR